MFMSLSIWLVEGERYSSFNRMLLTVSPLPFSVLLSLGFYMVARGSTLRLVTGLRQ